MENLISPESNISKKIMLYVWLVPFVLLFVATLLASILGGMEVFKIFTNPVEGFKNYPFGTEQGFNYYSKETYFAFSLTGFYEYVQALVVSLLLYRSNHKFTAIVVLLLPWLLGLYLSINYSSWH